MQELLNKNILGIGTDITYINKIKKIINNSINFPKHILTDYEYQIFLQKNKHKQIEYLAKRWAAKESVFKAMPSGIFKNLIYALRIIEIYSDIDNKPKVRIINKNLSNYLEEKYGKTNIFLSLSQDNDYAISFCVIESLQ